jgi:CheY-like chemotaxis protein
MDVLLVEDDALIRMCLAELLAAAGLRTTAVSDPAEALDLIAALPPAVLVTDVNLGARMNGLALAEAARRCRPSIHVVIISGRPENLDGHMSHPSDRFLPKPFLPEDLLRIIQELRAG